MTTKSAYQRQPTKLDYASPTQFRFNIIKLPKVEYYCTAVNIPGVSLNNASHSTPLKEVPLPGTTLTYEPLVLTFLVAFFAAILLLSAFFLVFFFGCLSFIIF